MVKLLALLCVILCFLACNHNRTENVEDVEEKTVSESSEIEHTNSEINFH